MKMKTILIAVAFLALCGCREDPEVRNVRYSNGVKSWEDSQGNRYYRDMTRRRSSTQVIPADNHSAPPSPE